MQGDGREKYRRSLIPNAKFKTDFNERADWQEETKVCSISFTITIYLLRLCFKYPIRSPSVVAGRAPGQTEVTDDRWTNKGLTKYLVVKKRNKR